MQPTETYRIVWPLGIDILLLRRELLSATFWPHRIDFWASPNRLSTCSISLKICALALNTSTRKLQTNKHYNSAETLPELIHTRSTSELTHTFPQQQTTAVKLTGIWTETWTTTIPTTCWRLYLRGCTPGVRFYWRRHWNGVRKISMSSDEYSYSKKVWRDLV